MYDRSVTIASDGGTLVAGNNKVCERIPVILLILEKKNRLHERGGNQGNCYVWKIKQTRDLVDLQPVTMFNAHPKYLTRCLLSPDTK